MQGSCARPELRKLAGGLPVPHSSLILILITHQRSATCLLPSTTQVRDRRYTTHDTAGVFCSPHAPPRPLHALNAGVGYPLDHARLYRIAPLRCDGARTFHTRMHKRVPRAGRRTRQLPSLRWMIRNSLPPQGARPARRPANLHPSTICREGFASCTLRKRPRISL